MEFDLPTDKVEAIINEFDLSGEAWVENYPRLLDECVERWDLQLLGTATAGLPINVIFYCEDGNGKPLVLKIGHPHPEQKTEIIALRKYTGRRIVRIIDWDETTGSFLMDRIFPGEKFRDYTAGNDASGLNRSKMQIPLFRDISIPIESVDGLPSFDGWLKRGFAKFRDARPRAGESDQDSEFSHYIGLAESVFTSLRKRHTRNYLLHGDLHHENILESESGGWIAIDPKGVIGPRVMECGRFLHNFIVDEIPGLNEIEDATDEQIVRVLSVRFETFSELMDLDYSDIVAAAYVDLVLSTCWSINSNQVVNLNTIRVLSELL
jgi:streptomycin 6-kinase